MTWEWHLGTVTYAPSYAAFTLIPWVFQDVFNVTNVIFVFLLHLTDRWNHAFDDYIQIATISTHFGPADVASDKASDKASDDDEGVVESDS